MKINIQRAKDYTNPISCGIAKGLWRKGIFAIVRSENYVGLFLGFIPVWGKIPNETNKIAYKCSSRNFEPRKVDIGLYN
jgi:hypothetical protein